MSSSLYNYTLFGNTYRIPFLRSPQTFIFMFRYSQELSVQQIAHFHIFVPPSITGLSLHSYSLSLDFQNINSKNRILIMILPVYRNLTEYENYTVNLIYKEKN